MSRYRKHECVLCGTRSGDVPHFRFPKDVLQRTIWANFCDVDPASMSVNHKLCYRHFDPADLIDNRYCGGYVTKKQDAVPVIKHIEGLENSDDSPDEYDSVETVHVTQKECSQMLSSGGGPLLNKSDEGLAEVVEVISCTADTDSDEDLVSNESVSEASEEDYPCNFDDMQDVRRTVTRLQTVIFARKRTIKSVQQKNRRLIKKIRRLKGDIVEYAQKHCLNLDKIDKKAEEESD